MAEEKKNKSQLESLVGILSNTDKSTLKEALGLMNPIISPWTTLGAGGLLGLYGQHEANKDQQRAIQLNAKMAQLSPWTGMKPQQMSFQKPSTLGHVLGGIGTAQGVAGSINEFSVAKNLRDKFMKEDSSEEQDVTLADIQNARRRDVGEPVGVDPQYAPRGANDYQAQTRFDPTISNIGSPHARKWFRAE